MATKDSKYNVTLGVSLNITNADGTPFSKLETSIDYDGMDYQQLMATQQVVVSLGQNLLDLGWAASAIMGFGDPKIDPKTGQPVKK